MENVLDDVGVAWAEDSGSSMVVAGAMTPPRPLPVLLLVVLLLWLPLELLTVAMSSMFNAYAPLPLLAAPAACPSMVAIWPRSANARSVSTTGCQLHNANHDARDGRSAAVVEANSFDSFDVVMRAWSVWPHCAQISKSSQATTYSFGM